MTFISVELCRLHDMIYSSLISRLVGAGVAQTQMIVLVFTIECVNPTETRRHLYGARDPRIEKKDP